MNKVRRPITINRTRVATHNPNPARLFMPHNFANKVELIDYPPMVYMTREVFSRMWHFVDIADKEVSWLGTVRQTQYGNFLIEEVFLLEQEVSATQTEISEDGIARLAQELIDTRQDGVDVVNRIRFWGHSHVQMDTSPSGQDENQMQHFQQDCAWFVRGILNKLGCMRFDIFLWDIGVRITDVSWAIYDEFVDRSRRAEIEADFKTKVTTGLEVEHEYLEPVDGQRRWEQGHPAKPIGGAMVFTPSGADLGDDDVS